MGRFKITLGPILAAIKFDSCFAFVFRGNIRDSRVRFIIVMHHHPRVALKLYLFFVCPWSHYSSSPSSPSSSSVIPFIRGVKKVNAGSGRIRHSLPLSRFYFVTPSIKTWLIFIPVGEELWELPALRTLVKKSFGHTHVEDRINGEKYAGEGVALS